MGINNINPLIQQLKRFFSFNKRQERGVLILLFLIFIGLMIKFIFFFGIKDEPYDFSSSFEEIKAWRESERKESPKIKKHYQAELSKELKYSTSLLKPFLFNPNIITSEQWLEMGMPLSIVKTIMKYRSKGGRFYEKKDLLKIYGLTPVLYDQIYDFIIFPKEKVKEDMDVKDIGKAEPFKQEIKVMNLNSIDSLSLLNIPGIGPFYAGHIVEYRKRLGGFIKLSQLFELYKMDSTRYLQWIPYLIISDSSTRKIDLNQADFKTILRHPYMDYETTKRIVNYRRKLGRIAGLYQLRKDSILSDSLYHKLEPYIKVD